MITLAAGALVAMSLALLCTGIVLFIECVATFLPRRDRSSAAAPRPTLAVIVPAYNEASRITSCVESLRAQLGADHRVVVVADNCEDDTADLARRAGAIVLERCCPEKRGKGYALDHAVRFLADAAPDVVVVMDADCRAAPGAIETIARLAAACGRPVQGCSLLEPDGVAGPLHRISLFAFTVKNLVRPLGLHRLGLPCLLMGTGMAFPWDVIRNHSWAGPHTAEDMRMTVRLAIAGTPPLFCSDVRFTGPLITEPNAGRRQRMRWEHGHLEALGYGGPALLRAAVAQRRFGPLWTALDLCVPPLSLVVAAWCVAMTGGVVLASVGGSIWPALLAGVAGVLIAAGVAAAWVGFAPERANAAFLLAAGRYFIQRLPTYAAFARRRESTWMDTGASPPRAIGSGVVRIGPVDVHALTELECVERIVHALRSRLGGWVLTASLDHLRLIEKDASFAALCTTATITVADGMPLVWASRLQGTPVPARVAGADLIGTLTAAAARGGASVFFLGGAPGTAEVAARVLARATPDLRVAGILCPALGFENDAESLRAVVEAVRAAAPDVVYVALGKPKQERLIAELRRVLPEAWCIGVGASFKFLSGRVRRAPPWMQRWGLEWLHRLAQEPRHLARRYLVQNIPYGVTLLLRATWQSARGARTV